MEEILTEDSKDATEESYIFSEHPYDLPGQWFVLNAQSGHEKKVKDNLLTRVTVSYTHLTLPTNREV